MPPRKEKQNKTRQTKQSTEKRRPKTEGPGKEESQMSVARLMSGFKKKKKKKTKLKKNGGGGDKGAE